MSRSTLSRMIPWAVGLTLAGCGTGGDGGPIVEEPDLAVEPDLAPSYPRGPYGGEEDKVFPNFKFKGYWSPTAKTGKANTLATYGDVTMEMVWKSEAKYALVQLGAYW